MTRYIAALASLVVLSGCFAAGEGELALDGLEGNEAFFLYDLHDEEGELIGYRDSLGYHLDDVDIPLDAEWLEGSDGWVGVTAAGDGVSRSAVAGMFLGCQESDDGTSTVLGYVDGDGNYVIETTIQLEDGTQSFVSHTVDVDVGNNTHQVTAETTDRMVVCSDAS